MVMQNSITQSWNNMNRIWKTKVEIQVDKIVYPINSLLIAEDVEVFYLLHKDDQLEDVTYIDLQDFSDVMDELGIDGIDLIYSNE